MADFTAEAKLKGIDDLSIPFSKGLRKAEKAAKRSFGRMEKLGFRARRAMAFLGQRQFNPGAGIRKAGRATSATIGKMTRLAGAVGGVGALAINQFGKFELALSRIGNLLDGDVDAVEVYGDQLKRLSLQFGIPQVEVAEAAYQAFSSGVDKSSEALADFLPAAAKAAKAGGAELGDAVSVLTTIMENFGLTAEDTISISDKLFLTEKEGVTTFGELAASFGQVAAQAKAVNAPLDDALSAVASLTKGLGKGSTPQAVTQLSALLSGIQAPGGRKGFFKRAKLPTGAEALKQVGGLTKYIGLIREVVASGKKIGGVRGKDVITQLFGRKEAQKALFRLIDQGFPDLVRVTKDMGTAAKITEKNWANMAKRTGQKVQQLKVGVSGLFTELGAGLVAGLGVETTDPAKIAANFEIAGKKVRSASKGFAEGFIKALVPAGDLANMDFDAMAKSAGTGFGKMVTQLGKLASFAVRLAESLIDVGTFLADIDVRSGGADALDRKQAKLGFGGQISTVAETLKGGDEEQSEVRRKLQGFESGNRALDQILQAAGATGQKLRLGTGTFIDEQNPLELFNEATRRTRQNAVADTGTGFGAIQKIQIETLVKLSGDATKGAVVTTKVKPAKGLKIGKTGTTKVGT